MVTHYRKFFRAGFSRNRTDCSLILVIEAKAISYFFSNWQFLLILNSKCHFPLKFSMSRPKVRSSSEDPGFVAGSLMVFGHSLSFSSWVFGEHKRYPAKLMKNSPIRLSCSPEIDFARSAICFSKSIFFCSNELTRAEMTLTVAFVAFSWLTTSANSAVNLASKSISSVTLEALYA